MKTFNDLKPGDKLLRKAGFVGNGLPWAQQVWVEYEVEKVTKAFYYVDGEKYRKDQEGKGFRSFYLPGVGDTPEKATDPELVERIREVSFAVNSTEFVGYINIKLIKDMDKAYELALKLKSVIAEIQTAIKESN